MAPQKNHLPLDRVGRKIRVGARVRVIGVPDLKFMAPSNRRESETVFRHILGTYKRVSGFDNHGFAELEFAIRNGAHRGSHLVMIEPNLLSVAHRNPRG
jgi:hypothetical protein